MRTYNKWSPESYEWAMRLRSERGWPAKRIEEETGVPSSTIYGWYAQGRVPLFAAYDGEFGRKRTGAGRRFRACRKGHTFTAWNTKWNSTLGRRQCRRCAIEAQRRHYWRSHHKFHPTYNPNVDLAPVEHLWLPAPDVLEYLSANATREHVAATYDKRSWQRKRIWDWGNRDWIRFDAVDRIFSGLGLVVTSSGLEPIYSTRRPATPIDREEVKTA